LFLFVIQRQQRICDNPPHVQFFCLFTGLQVSQKELATNILARQQHKNEHSVTAPPNTLIYNKSIQWCLAAYNCIISCYSCMQPICKIFGVHMRYSHLITPTVSPGNYKFLGLANTEVGSHMFFPHTNSWWLCSLPYSRYFYSSLLPAHFFS